MNIIMIFGFCLVGLSAWYAADIDCERKDRKGLFVCVFGVLGMFLLMSYL